MRYIVRHVAPWLVLGSWFLVIGYWLLDTLMYCGQTAGRIEMKFGMEVRLAPSNFVSDGGPIAPMKGGYAPPKFDPCPLWPNGWMDRDEIWYGGSSRH